MAVSIPTELGFEKIPKLLRQYAVPSIIAMTASSLYNMCDSIFIGQGVGPYAIAGLAVTFPLMNLSTAFGTLVGVGASTLMSVLLGQKNYQAANRVLGNSIVMNIISGVLFMAVVYAFLTPILYFFGGSDNTVRYAREYMIIILSGNIITHLYFGLNNVVRVIGLPKKAMGATILTVVVNCILDPLFIFVFGWGIRGAAIATVLSQLIALVYILGLISDKNRVVHLQRGIYRLRRKLVSQMLSIGLAPFLLHIGACLIVIVLNKQLIKYGGDMAIGAYGIVNRLGFIAIMIVIGLNQGMQPIAGYNYGANKHERVTAVLNLTIKWATLITTIAFLVAEIFPRALTRLFTSDPELINHTVLGMRIYFCTFPIIGFQMVASNFFQCIGLVKKAIFLSLTRQVIFLLPLLIILPPIFKIGGVWWAIPASDIFASVLTAYMLYRQKQIFKSRIALETEALDKEEKLIEEIENE
ncbi:MAG: MATE family efflux transporter [Bacteroidales bacterium]|nr:MATE family efflux transporter [Bacteroidales bacterium]